MKHSDYRKEKSWAKFSFNQPYAKGLKRLQEEVLTRQDFDPATLWQWGTMQAMAVIQILKDCEREFGEKGQQLVKNSLLRVGHDVGRQLFTGFKKPDGLSEAEIVSFFTTLVNKVVYASPETPHIDAADKVSVAILWCPHQDHYTAFDCRVQRYLVQGMLDALFDTGWISRDWQLKFTCTIPAGAKTCNFTFWRASSQEQAEWELYSRKLEQRALKQAIK